MKTKQYVDKYTLNVNDKFSHPDFIEDLTYEFISLLEVGKVTENIKGFENACRAIKMKWDAINNKTVGQLPEKLWGYFYFSVIIKMKKELFPDVIEREKQKREEKRKHWEQRKNEREEFDSFFRWSFLGLFKQINKAPTEALKFLELVENPKPTTDEVSKAYRKLSIKYHPDQGGKQEDFIILTESKNKVLQWIN